VIYLYHSSLLSDVTSLHPQPSPILDRLVFGPSDDPLVQTNPSKPQPPISPSPLESADEAHHVRDYELGRYGSTYELLGHDLNTEHLLLACTISVICMFPDLTHSQIQLPLTFRETGMSKIHE